MLRKKSCYWSAYGSKGEAVARLLPRNRSVNLNTTYSANPTSVVSLKEQTDLELIRKYGGKLGIRRGKTVSQRWQ